MLSDLSAKDRERVADLLGQYYDWYTGNGGTHSDDILSLPLEPAVKKELLSVMDDLNVIMGLLPQRFQKRQP